MDAVLGLVDGSQITLADGYYMGSIFAPVLESLDKARLNPDQIDAVLLNGGSCRNPLVVRAFRELDIFRNAEVLEKGDLDLAVARGAAVRCFFKHYQNYDPITPIVSAELGVITHGENHEMLVSAGKGAKAVLMPISARKQLVELPDEVATRVTIHYYSDVRDALLKALVE